MSMPRFIAFSRAFLRATLSDEICASVTTYSARRIAPSAAHAARMSPAERCDIGGWTDSVGVGDHEARREARRLAMPTRYSEHRLDAQAILKAEVVSGVRISLQLLSAAEATVGGAQAVLDTATWEDIFRVWPPREATMALATAPQKDQEPTTTDEESCLLLATAPLIQTDVDSEDEEVPQSLDTSSSTGSSSSSSSDDSCEADVDEHKWLLSKGPRARLHRQLHDPYGCKTACGRTLRQPLEGTGSAQAQLTGAQWSPRCYALLPARVREHWHKLNVTDE
jgi:hypothetical protein